MPIKNMNRDFPGGPVVWTSPSNAGVTGSGSIPGRGTKIPQATRRSKNKKQKKNNAGRVR